ncbi:MAG: rsbU 1 [Verrucomicrobiales bacterium]|nr:rsbU 1 [Verrucomicrobiales bacterium]
MALLIATGIVGAGQQFPIETEETIIGRSTGVPVKLEGSNISRRHARILCKGSSYLIEDLGSSNGTFVNDRRVNGPTPLTQNDVLRIGSYSFSFVIEDNQAADLTIQRETVALPENTDLYRENSSQKLQAVLQLAHDLGNTLELDAILNRFFDLVVKLFPKTDRAIVLFIENGEPVLRLARERQPTPNRERLFSRTLLKQVIDKGIAVLAEDVRTLDANRSLAEMGVRSLLCVPFRAQGTPVFGVVQLEKFRAEDPFTGDDLHMLTAITLQASMALDKSRMHQRIIAQERITNELALAREIQLAFLPRSIPVFGGVQLDLLADLKAAEEVSGDFYDYIQLDTSKVLIVVADVSGKGMPAALFMSMIRALLRQVCKTVRSPAGILRHLNEVISQDNPKFMFVTFVMAVYDIESGNCVLARAGHPAPLLRSSNGSVEEISCHQGCLVGITEDCPAFEEFIVQLSPGDTLIFYTDGFTEAARHGTGELFGTRRLLAMAEKVSVTAALHDYVSLFRSEVDRYCAPAPPQDDLTLLLLRHCAVN